MGTERYRYPQDLPKAAATGARSARAAEPAFEAVPPNVVADTGTNPWRAPIRASSSTPTDSRQILFGPIDGPPRNSCSGANPDEALAAVRRWSSSAIFGVVMVGADREPVHGVRGVSERVDKDYSAVFIDASSLKGGDSVRVAGVRVGTVTGQTPRTTRCWCPSTPTTMSQLTTGTRAAVRYLNLVGDRYLDLSTVPDDQPVAARRTDSRDRTQPALDLDLLLGGLKPVIRGLDPQDVNALPASLLQIFQGQGDTLQSLLTGTSSFSNRWPTTT